MWTSSLAGLLQLGKELVEPLCHGHLAQEQEGTVSVCSPLQLHGGATVLCSSHQGHALRCVLVVPSKRWTYWVGLRVMEPAVSRVEQAEGHLSVGSHLWQAGQRLTQLQGRR